jgi:hypothetical protein
MKFDDLNRWMSLLASAGVIAGLLLLAFELQQNRDMMRAQTRNEIALGIIDLLSLTAGNAQLASVVRRGDAGEELTPDEYFQYRLNVIATLRYYENVHYQYLQGLYDKPQFERGKQAWRAYALRSPGAQHIWCELRGTFVEDFVREWEALIGDIYQCQ